MNNYREACIYLNTALKNIEKTMNYVSHDSAFVESYKGYVLNHICQRLEQDNTIIKQYKIDLVKQISVLARANVCVVDAPFKKVINITFEDGSLLYFTYPKDFGAMEIKAQGRGTASAIYEHPDTDYVFIGEFIRTVKTQVEYMCMLGREPVIENLENCI